MITILNIEPLHYSRDARRILRSFAELHESEMTRTELLGCLKDFDVLITRLGFHVDRELIEAGPRLKAIVTATTGLDHIDLAFAQSRNIEVVSLKGETEFLRSVHATAEHTMALILALLRRVPAAAAHVQRGCWGRDQFRGRELHGKTVGIVGYGRLGQILMGYLKAFDTRILVADPALNVDSLQLGYTLVPLERLLPDTDVVTLHVNLCPETYGLFGRKQFNAMKPGAWFINTSRGALVDEDELLRALKSGRLGGAAIDVICDELSLNLENHPLVNYAREHDNLIITPHIGGCTVESMEKTERYLAEKLRRHLVPARSHSQSSAGS